MWLDISISLLGAAVAGCIFTVLWNVPSGQRSVRLRPWWLVSWGCMCVHFVLNALSQAKYSTFDWLADLLLVIAVWTLVDGIVGSGIRSLRWAMRGAALLTAIWIVVDPEWYPHIFPAFSVASALGVLLIAGGLAVSQLTGASRLTRNVLSLGLLGWGCGMMMPYATESAILFINVETLICKTVCGLALILFVVDEQRRLAESHRDYLIDLYHKAPVWYHTAALDGTILEINQVALDLLGARREEIIGKRKLSEFCTEKCRESLLPFVDIVSASESPSGNATLDLELAVPEGPARFMRGYLRPVYETTLGTPVIRCVLLDVTQERELQEQLVEAQKLKALGTLTAGLAHDFNNLLSAQLGQLELISMHYRGQLPGDVSGRLNMVRRSAQLAADLVAQLLTFARRSPRQMMPVDLGAVLADVEALLRHSLPANISIQLRMDCERAVIWGNSSQLQQALLNLAVNAQQAMPSGGELEFELHGSMSPPTALMDGVETQGRVRWVRLRVRDTGVGMTESVRQQIFEPFFTTRSHGHGTGLGLATVYGIIEAHHGKIQVESVPNHGTTFSLYFQARADLEIPSDREPAEVQSSSRCCHILLVEDEASVAEVTAQMLTSLGHTVITADRPSRALLLAEQQSAPFDLLVTDLTMPEMNGKELAERMRARWPHLPVLLISGYDFQHDEAMRAISLSKPLTLSSLRRGVDQAIGVARTEARA